MNRINELLLYHGKSALLESVRNPQALDAESYASVIQNIVEMSVARGFSGNLWQSCLTRELVYHENAWSRACEIHGAVSGGLNALARHDMEIFRELFHYDFSDVEKRLNISLFPMVTDFQPVETDKIIFNRRIRDRITALSVQLASAKSAEEFKGAMEEFYREYGCGKFGLHKAFRIVHRTADSGPELVPITNIQHVSLDDLIGYEIPKKKLIENTEAFVEGRRANNCLLFGDAGTGKSTSVKAILNMYYDRGLRMIEVYKHQFRDLVDILAEVKNRNYKFIIYMDDLSFEEFETDYKYLKAVIEGGLEKKPDNVLIYATSNRRHLIRENYSDKGEEVRQDMHTSDTVQEKLSLVYRFGVSIYFGAPNKKEFEEILRGLALKNGINIPEEKLFADANAWELSHGGRTGRTAQQFIDHLLGKEGED